MGSYSASNSSTSAIDKRQVISENAVGYTVDGNSNTFGNKGLSNISMGGAGSELNVTSLDGGAIDRAFDFANSSLSQMIALTINRDKTADAAANAVQDSAMDQIAQIGSGAAETETANKIKDNKYLIIGVVLVGAAWFYWGKK